MVDPCFGGWVVFVVEVPGGGGEPESEVISTIEKFREGDKHNAHYYAELTVRKAAASLALTDDPRPR